MEIQETKETETILDENNDFISEGSPGSEDRHTPAYTLEVPEDYVVGVDAGTPFAPEFRDANGAKLDPSTRVIVQGADRQGNALGDAIILDERLSAFEYSKMRKSEDYAVTTSDGILLDEYDQLHVYCVTPSGANTFDPAQSRMTLGNANASWGTPVEIVEHNALSAEESAAVKQASRQKGGR